ncbi:unnamed protein product, partial [Heterosigma akashiwo]
KIIKESVQHEDQTGHLSKTSDEDALAQAEAAEAHAAGTLLTQEEAASQCAAELLAAQLMAAEQVCGDCVQ